MSKMKRKKVLSVFLILACMICGGCGKTGLSNQTTQSDSTKENQTTQNNSSKQEKKYVEIEKTEMKGEITVSSFLENEFLNVAAKQFMKEYPNVTVTVNVYAENIAEPSEKDYQTMFNTKLMGGDAEDIIMNSFLPVVRYCEMGAFEDLSKYINQTSEWNEKNYFMNVIKAAEQEDGAIYLLPYMARFDILDFEDDLVKEEESVKNTLGSIESIRFSDGMSLAKRLVENTKKNNSFLSTQSPVQYATYLIKDRLNEFLDIKNRKVNINTSEYTELLNSIREMEENGYFDIENIDFYNTNTEYHIAGVVDYDKQAAFLAVCNKEEKTYSAMPIVDNEGNIMLNSNYCLMLNSSSKNKSLAWEFMKYLLSEQMQSMPSLHGVPINRKGFEKAAKRDYDKGKEENPKAGSLENYQNLLKKWMGEINACDILDPSIINLLEEENERFFEGEQNAEETAKRLQRKMEQYFNE